MKDFFRTLRGRDFWLHRAGPVLLALAAGLVAWCQLEFSNILETEYLSLMLAQWPVYAPLNALTALCLTLLFFALIGRWSLATALSGAVFTVLAVANYYTRDLHGTPLMPQDIHNVTTAANVLGQYSLGISKRLIMILGLYVVVLAIALVQRRLQRPAPRGWKRRLTRWAGCAGSVFAILYIGYFSPMPVKPSTLQGWTFQTTYYVYGYLAGTVEACGLLVDPIVAPDGYSDQMAADAIAMAEDYTPTAARVSEQEYPDIVLILSESWYDFSLVTDLQADVGYTSVIGSLPNTIQGHTVVPNVGGGTNTSEYEMLTSNSVSLMPGITPFNGLDLHGADSFVTYLEDLGYATMAAHPAVGANYRRNVVWPVLGFDIQHFIEDFPTQETYGDRMFLTDSATYGDLAALYEAMPEDQPRFAFLISIQSHGDYDMNDPELDLVHAAADYSEYDAQVDEYLSCMYLTDQAFVELTQYFTQVYEETGRRVIVAMAGDHAPSFVTHVSDESIAPQEELQLRQRSTPFVIWANYPLKNAGMISAADPLNRLDLCLFAPLVAEQAGLPLTPYYEYLLAMGRQVPVFTLSSAYLAADGAIYALGENEANDAWVHGYFALEYNNIGAHAHRDPSWFTLGG